MLDSDSDRGRHPSDASSGPRTDRCHPQTAAGEKIGTHQPPEIPTLFFTFTKPSDVANHIPSLTSPPLMITLFQVCSSWRSMALATPNLWTGLCISVRFSIRRLERAAIRQYEEMATQWFSRARPALGLFLKFHDPNYIKYHDFSSIILSCPERFRELKIRVEEPNSLASFFRGHIHHSCALDSVRGPHYGLSPAGGSRLLSSSWTPAKIERCVIFLLEEEEEVCALAAADEPQDRRLGRTFLDYPVCSVYQSRKWHLPSQPSRRRPPSNSQSNDGTADFA